ncbi:MAG: hypothetical protein FAF05_01040 [Epsilonproteobacteria bacterium]|nr:hypothetical protein [Campylobacterota bacterium]
MEAQLQIQQNKDASVKFRGISVGKVERLRISPQNSEQVEVLVSILKDTPIQGITGLTYINLTVGQTRAQITTELQGQTYTVIPSEASFFKNFSDSFGSASEKMAKMLYQGEKLLIVAVTLMEQVQKHLATKRFVAKRKPEHANAKVGVEALNDALGEVLQKSVAWVVGRSQ